MSTQPIDAVERFSPGGDWHGLDFPKLRAAAKLIRDPTYPTFWIDPVTGAKYTVGAVQGAWLQARNADQANGRTPQQAGKA